MTNRHKRRLGLSPRGRGKPRGKAAWPTVRRSIPAWAGETRVDPETGGHDEVYPRVGGGNSSANARLAASAGLSPRGRGKRVSHAHHQPRAGSIPAWAGETRPRPAQKSSSKVYPRVGGGNDALRALAALTPGLSPRGRGKHCEPPPAQRRIRSIPAWAGETSGDGIGAAGAEVYPRVGGGNAIEEMKQKTDWGLSPRGRGKRFAA